MSTFYNVHNLYDHLKNKLGLRSLVAGKNVALIDWPAYPNVGDHMIWLGCILALKDAGANITYSCAIEGFSINNLTDACPDGPLVFTGGGNFGDLYPWHQKFREDLINAFPDRDIIILPQTLYFQSRDALNIASKILNKHSRVTLYTRDKMSFNLSCQMFGECNTVLAPDMAFMLAEISIPPRWQEDKNIPLYLCRNDHDRLDYKSSSELEKSDWISFDYYWRYINKPNSLPFPWSLPGLVPVWRESWQRRLSKPGRWKWVNEQFIKLSDTLFCDNPEVNLLTKQSLRFLLEAIDQLTPYERILTNRTHGHILCLLIGKNHALTEGHYYKNKQFYETWSSQMKGCTFIGNPDQAKTWLNSPI